MGQRLLQEMGVHATDELISSGNDGSKRTEEDAWNRLDGVGTPRAGLCEQGIGAGQPAAQPGAYLDEPRRGRVEAKLRIAGGDAVHLAGRDVEPAAHLLQCPSRQIANRVLYCMERRQEVCALRREGGQCGFKRVPVWCCGHYRGAPEAAVLCRPVVPAL